MKNLPVLVFLLTLWMACKPPQTSLPPGKMLQLRELNGKAVPELVKATMQFDTTAKRVAGNTSCNAYSGPYEQNGSSLKFGALMTTKKFCTETASWEQEFLTMLSQTDNFTYSGEKLKLSAGAKTVAVFE